MKLCRHFYGAKRNVYLEHDFLHATDRGDELKVRFTRLRGLEVDYADTTAPACAVWELHGFAEDEMGELKSFLQANLALLMEEAEATRNGDAGLVEMAFEVEDEFWARFSRHCYAEGMTPEQGAIEAIMERAKGVLERSGVEEASGATSQDLAER